MESKEIITTAGMMDALIRAVTARNVTEEFTLQRLLISNVRAALSHGVCYTNVDVDFDVIDRNTTPKVSVADDGVRLTDMQTITIRAKHTFWHHTFWRHPTKLEEAKMVRKVLVDGLVHEINECLTVNGVRVFEPHKPPKQPRPLYWQMLKLRLFGREEDL